MKIFILFGLIQFINCSFAFAQSDSEILENTPLSVGIVSYLRGNAFRNNDELKDGMKIFEKDIVKTLKSSVVKITLHNQSIITIAPESEMLIEEYESDDENLIHLLKGALRAKVKNNPANKENSLIVKSTTAALGVRGTDFQFTYNSENKISSVLTYEGLVAFRKISSSKFNYVDLDNELSKSNSYEVKPGQFSANNIKTGEVNFPTKISSTQFHALKRNNNFKVNLKKTVTNQKNYRSFIPNGAPAKNFKSNSSLRIKNKTLNKSEKENSKNISDGFYNEDSGQFAPTPGGYLDSKTGIYIAPNASSNLIEELGTYNPTPELGTIDQKTGEYIPPKGFKLTPKGEFKPADPKQNKLPPPPNLNLDPNKFSKKTLLIKDQFVEVKNTYKQYENQTGLGATNNLNQIQNQINQQNNQQTTSKNNTTFLTIRFFER